MRTVGRGAVALPINPPLEVSYGFRRTFARRTKIHTGSGVGFFRDHLDLLQPDQAYAALPQYSGIMSGAWRAFVPLICFDIVEAHLPELVLCQNGMVEGIPPPCDTEVELRLTSRKGRKPKNCLEINGRHMARWDQRLELLVQSAPINAAGAPTSPNYMAWFLSITRRWMTPRGIIAAVQYAITAPMMT
ncbi:serine/threonine-protein phosphatase 7 long form homolog isoform X2 [Amaranthus tricolor]|uniref:serine/threonine-protein phosphatase 7 long form homolog isoform X2 n=1 Tax=Amaranthus tricolor TaxID=29722 RepID=UPI002589B67A|nr:serine/threonine-protein phosphatase 7 long form homolog isoform X2 [Amaranthus tricolor]